MDGVGQELEPAEEVELALDDGIELLDTDDLVNRLEKLGREFGGEGIGRSDFEDRQLESAHLEGFHDVMIRDTTAGNAKREARLATLLEGASRLLTVYAADFDTVGAIAEGELIGNGRCALLDLAVVQKARARENDPALRVLHKAARDVPLPGGIIVISRGICELCPAIGYAATRLDGAAGVAYARGRAHDNGRMVALGELEGVLDHAVRLAGARRVENRHLGELRKIACVLLGLTRNGAGIISHDDDEATLDADVRERHERIARDVETDLLHRDEGTCAGIGRSRSSFESGFLVGGPLDMDGAIVVLGDGLKHLGRGRARIPAHEIDARVHSAEPEGLVSHEQLNWHVVSPRPRLLGRLSDSVCVPSRVLGAVRYMVPSIARSPYLGVSHGNSLYRHAW